MAELDHIQREATRPHALLGFDDHVRMGRDRQGGASDHAAFVEIVPGTLSTGQLGDRSRGLSSNEQHGKVVGGRAKPIGIRMRIQRKIIFARDDIPLGRHRRA
jgi:hypothetical protein